MDRGEPKFGVGTLNLPATGKAAALARRYVSDGAAHLPVELLQDARLVVSALVANAVRHGRPDIILTVRWHPAGISLAVSDEGAELPQLPEEHPGPDATSGRGPLLIDALASTWGIEVSPDWVGKTVWLELQCRPDEGAS